MVFLFLSLAFYRLDADDLDQGTVGKVIQKASHLQNRRVTFNRQFDAQNPNAEVIDVILQTLALLLAITGFPALANKTVCELPGQPNASQTTRQQAVSHRFRLDSSQSKFIAHALRGGLLWFKGHEHLVAAREFSGEAQLRPDSIAASSLQLAVKADSMVEISDAFTAAQKAIINRELREIVLEPEKYPEITFRSTDVTGRQRGTGEYDLKIGGNLTLHGITRRIVIPAKVSVTGDQLRAVGEFSINRSDFKVKATSAFHGLIRVRHKVKFTFDIVGHRAT